MAASVSKDTDGRGLRVVVVEWTSDSSGNVSSAVPDSGKPINGYLSHFDIAPDGTDTPTDQYDVTLLYDVGEGETIDLMGGQGANQSATAGAQYYSKQDSQWIPYAVVGRPTLTIANAGNTKKGTVTLYIREPHS